MSSHHVKLPPMGTELPPNFQRACEAVSAAKRLNNHLKQSPFTSLQTTGFKRKAIVVEINGQQCYARPDTCSDQDIITEDFAKKLNLSVKREDEYRTSISLGNGKEFRTTGLAVTKFIVPGLNNGLRWRSFHILEKCPVPLILGNAFINSIDLFQKRKHLLVEYPYPFSTIPTFKFLGGKDAPRVAFRANGKDVKGVADTGSDLNFVSLKCVVRNGWRIDRGRESIVEVLLGDGSRVETVGIVVVWIEMIAGDGFELEFHVLAGLPADVIFGEEFVYEFGVGGDGNVDEGEVCRIGKGEVGVGGKEKKGLGTLCMLVCLGRVQMLLVRLKRKGERGNSVKESEDEKVVRMVYEDRMRKRSVRKERNAGEVPRKGGEDIDVLVVERRGSNGS